MEICFDLYIICTYITYNLWLIYNNMGGHFRIYGAKHGHSPSQFTKNRWILPAGPIGDGTQAPSLSSATGEGRRAWPSCHPATKHIFLVFAAFYHGDMMGYGLVSMDFFLDISWIFSWYNGLPKWRYHGDIMGIWSGLNGLVEQLLVVFWKQWILPLGKVTSTFPANCPNLGIGSRKVLKETHSLLEFPCALRSSTLSPERFAMLWNLSLEPTMFKWKEFDPFCFPAIYDRCIN